MALLQAGLGQIQCQGPALHKASTDARVYITRANNTVQCILPPDTSLCPCSGPASTDTWHNL